jgi:hypothetical protein
MPVVLIYLWIAKTFLLVGIDTPRSHLLDRRWIQREKVGEFRAGHVTN